MRPPHDRHMDMTRRPAEDLLEVARVLLLLQGSILVATTIEALFWGFAFGGGAGVSLFLSGAAAAAILVVRARLRAGRRWTLRLIYIVEGLTVAALALDVALAIALTGTLPPAVALLTRFVLPVCVIALLGRAARSTAAPVLSSGAAVLEGVA